MWELSKGPRCLEIDFVDVVMSVVFAALTTHGGVLVLFRVVND